MAERKAPKDALDAMRRRAVTAERDWQHCKVELAAERRRTDAFKDLAAENERLRAALEKAQTTIRNFLATDDRKVSEMNQDAYWAWREFQPTEDVIRAALAAGKKGDGT